MEGFSDRIAVARATASGSAQAVARLALLVCGVGLLSGAIITSGAEAAPPTSAIGVELTITVTPDARVQAAGSLRNYSYLKRVTLVLESASGKRWTTRAKKVVRLKPPRRRKPGLSRFKFFWTPPSSLGRATVRVRFVDGSTTLATSARRVLAVRSGVGASGSKGGVVSVPPVAAVAPAPAAPTPSPQVLQVAAGAGHTCAVTTLATVKCWGANDVGQLGDGSTSQRPGPVQVAGLASVSRISTGTNHTCAVTTVGAAYCWGRGDSGQLGDGKLLSRDAPVIPVGLGSGVAAISAGDRHTCAVRLNGDALCWGANDRGQLGDSTTVDRPEPGLVTNLAGDVLELTTGKNHSCAILAGDLVYCWGAVDSAQAGSGFLPERPTPGPVNGLSGAVAISAGSNHTCVRTSSRAAKCWGENYSGQLGTGGVTLPRAAGVQVSSLTSGVTSVVAGGDHACALLDAGTVKCWGANGRGELGNGGTTGAGAPVQVSGLDSAASLTTAGVESTCALLTLGPVFCWGANTSGQLGDGTTTDRWTPVVVKDLAAG